MAGKYEALFDSPTPTPGEGTPSPQPAFQFSPPPTGKYQALFDSSPTPSATPSPTGLPSPPLSTPSMTPLTDQALQAQLSTPLPSTPVPTAAPQEGNTPPWYMLGVSENAPGLFEPLYTPKRIVGGETQLPDAPFLPDIRGVHREPFGMQEGLTGGAPPTHTAGNLEAATLNLLNGFVSGVSSARGVVSYLPPLFAFDLLRNSPELLRKLKEADKTPAYSQERYEVGLGIATTVLAGKPIGESALNAFTRWPEVFTKPMPGVVPRGQPPPEIKPAPPKAEMPGERGFVMGSRREIPGVKYQVGEVGPVRPEEEPTVILQHRDKTYAQDPASGKWMERIETAEGGAEARVLEPDESAADRTLVDELDFMLRKGGEKGATKEGQVPKSSQPKYPGIPSGPNIPANAPQVRETDRKQAGDSGGAGGETAQPQVTPGAPQPKLEARKKPEERIAELEKEEAESAAAGRPFSLIKSEELRKLKRDRVPIRQLLSKKDLKEHDKLQSRWSQLNFKFKKAVQHRDEDAQLDIAREQTDIKNKMRAIERKLPGSDIYDVVGIGGGPTGQTAAITAGSEDMTMIVLDVGLPGGASRKTPIYENIPGELGQTGRRRALFTRLAAERHGTQFEQIGGIESVTQDPSTGIWTIKTKGLGKLGGGGKTYKARTILGATGTRGKGAPFPIRDASGHDVTRGEFVRHANKSLPITGTAGDKSGVTVHLGDGISAAIEAHQLGDGAQAAIGGANSAGQGAIDMALSAKEYGGEPVTLIVRSPRLSMSGYLQKDVFELKQEGWIKVLLNTVVDHLEAPSAANGMKKVLVLKTKKGTETIETRMPVDSVASFTGGDPVTEWLPENILRDKKGYVQTTTDMRPLIENPQGQPIETNSGLYVAGSVRATSTNRMPPSEGEGVAAMEHIGKYITDLESAGRLPRWKEELRDYFNRDEFQRRERPSKHEPEHKEEPLEPKPLAPEETQVPEEAPSVKQKLDWSDITKPPKPETPPKLRMAQHVTGATTATLEQQQSRGGGTYEPDVLITRILQGAVKSLSDIDQTVLTRHRAALQAMRDDVGRRATNQNLTAGQKAEASATFEDLDAQIRLIDAAIGDASMMTSKANADAWHSFRMRDYTPESMKTKMEVAKDGVPLTPEETKFIETQSEKLMDSTAAIAARKIEIRWKPGDIGDKRLRDLQEKQFKAKEALDHSIFRATLKSKGKLAQTLYIGGELLGMPRVLMTSLDLSAVLRQGGLFMMSHPLRSLSAFPDMLRAARSDKGYFSLMQDIRERPNADLYRESKLGITELTSPKLSEMEEMYMSRWAEKIPLVAGSQRAYVYYLNRLRADAFDVMARNLPRNGAPTPAQAEAISNYINVFTGRGNPGSHAQAMASLNNVFFAPRYQLSRFQALIGQPLYYAWARSPEVRNMIAMEYGRTMAGMGVVYTLAQLLGGDEVQIEMNPVSTDFGKVRVGDTRFDLMFGLGQATVFLSRLASGRTKTDTGEVKKLFGKDVPVSQRTVSDIITTFFRSKLAPIPSALWNARMGKKVTGEATDVVQETLGMLFPMTGQDLYNSMRKYGVPRTTAITLASFFGIPVQDYEQKGKPANAPKPHRTKSHQKSSESRQRDRSRF